MPRARLISPEFWTAEAVVDCAPMTRLLLLGLSNFADDFGVLPLRPRTLRLQVFPGDALDDEQVRAMLDELAARGLVRLYTVEGVAYLSIVDWEVHQRVGKRARRRYPVLPSAHHGGATVTSGIEADQGLTVAPHQPDDRNPERSPSAPPAVADPPPAPVAEAPPSRPAAASDAVSDAAWHEAVALRVRRALGADVPADVAQHAARWRAEGRDLVHEVLPAIDRVAAVAVEFNKPFQMAWVSGAMAGGGAQNHSKP